MIKQRVNLQQQVYRYEKESTKKKGSSRYLFLGYLLVYQRGLLRAILQLSQRS